MADVPKETARYMARAERDHLDRIERARRFFRDDPVSYVTGIAGGFRTCQCTAPDHSRSGDMATAPDTCGTCGLPTGTGGVVYGSPPGNGPRNRHERRAAGKRDRARRAIGT